MRFRRTIVLFTAGLLAFGGVGQSNSATKPKTPKSGTACKIAKLDSATARHTATSWIEGGVTGEEIGRASCRERVLVQV